jgi:hypothetical protein
MLERITRTPTELLAEPIVLFLDVVMEFWTFLWVRPVT